MISTFAGLEIGKRSLVAHTQGLNTVGHNLSNASTEGYSRQRAQIGATDPLYVPALNREETPGQIGQGAEVDSVQRVRDELLDKRIVQEQSRDGYWATRDNYLSMVAQVYNEPSESSTRSAMDQFWSSWQDLSKSPSDMAARGAVIERGKTLMDRIHNQYDRLKGIRDQLNGDIEKTVYQVNDFTRQIAALNEEIEKAKAMGDSPNDLMDRRDLLVDKLSNIIDVTVDQRDPNEFMIHSGGQILVQGRLHRELALSTDKNNEGYSRVTWKDLGTDTDFRNGSLHALMELRDGDVRDEIQKLDTMALNFVDLVNENHRAGYGMNGKTGQDFFVDLPFITNIAGNYDRNGDGTYDSSYIFRISGSNKLGAQDQIGLEGNITLPGANGPISIAYHPTDTVDDVINRINNSGAEVVARLDREGKLELKATPSGNVDDPDFVIRGVEDSGQFLAGYAGILKQGGASGAFAWTQADAALSLSSETDFAVAPVAHPAAWIEINPDLVRDPSSIAAGYGTNGQEANSGDGSTALSISELRHQNVMVGAARTFDDFFAESVATIGLKSQEAKRQSETTNLVMKDLHDQRESISGVNIDEELTQMIKFQHGYSAAAKFISVQNELLDTIINRMGV